MSYLGSTDTFTWQTIKDTERMLLETDQAKAHLAYTAMQAVNNATDEIRRATDRITRSLGNATQNLDGNLPVDTGSHSVSGYALEMDRAIGRREQALQTLLILLGEAGLKAAMAAMAAE